MSTKKKPKHSKQSKSDARRFLEKLGGGPLTFGRMLRSIRLGEELSQAAFAELLGVTRSHICDLEKDRKTVSSARAAKFADLLGYSRTEFVRLVLQAELKKAGLKMKVKIEAA